MGVANWIYDYRLPLDVVDGYEINQLHPTARSPSQTHGQALLLRLKSTARWR